MMKLLRKPAAHAQRFARDESGAAMIEFMMILPAFMLLFSMVFENGIISARNVMLEHGLDMAVRDVRIGRTPDPTLDELKEDICDYAAIIPDCMKQLQLEMVKRDLRDWDTPPSQVKCVDRSVEEQPKFEFTNGGNNELVILRACARFDPILPSSGLGRIYATNPDGVAGGSYALVSTSAFVVEPFRKDDDNGS